MAQDSEVQKMTNPKQFTALVKFVNEKKAKIAGLTGDIGQRVKEAADNANLHRGAFGLVAKLARQDEEKRNDFLRAFSTYCDYAQEAGLFGSEHVGDLLAEAPEVDEDAEAAARNADTILKGIKPLPESVNDDERPPRRGRPPKVTALDEELAPGSYKLN